MENPVKESHFQNLLFAIFRSRDNDLFSNNIKESWKMQNDNGSFKKSHNFKVIFTITLGIGWKLRFRLDIS